MGSNNFSGLSAEARLWASIELESLVSNQIEETKLVLPHLNYF